MADKGERSSCEASAVKRCSATEVPFVALQVADLKHQSQAEFLQ
ncbi:hypothetical protein ABUP62_19310 [Acinetobacter baumannii]